MNAGRLVEADLTSTGERFEPGVRVAIGEDGRLAAVAPDELSETVVFGAGDEVIVTTAVGGRFAEHRAREEG